MPDERFFGFHSRASRCASAICSILHLVFFSNGGTRVINDVEGYFKLKAELGDEFNHFIPSQWLLMHPEWFEENKADLGPALDRFEALFKKLSGYLV